jgi:hypothetical protein
MLTLAPRNVWRLRLSLDVKYRGIVTRAKATISEVATRGAGEIARTGCVELYSNWKHWICLFPQDGPGPKHLRTIRLEQWQERSVLDHPGPFLAGLIHSDGCRCLNRVKGHEYPRYFFSNRSAEIRAYSPGHVSLSASSAEPTGRGTSPWLAGRAWPSSIDL